MDPTNWLPFYPDLPTRTRARLEPTLAGQPPYNTGIFPVPDLLAGLTFLPRFPDRVPHVVEPREQLIVTTAAIFVTAVAPESWLPIYPVIVPRPRLSAAARPSITEAPPSVQVVIAQSLAWGAGYPSRVPRVMSRQPDGAFSTVTPLVAASTIVCSELVNEALRSPVFLSPVLRSPGVVREGLTRPQLIAEALC